MEPQKHFKLFVIGFKNKLKPETGRNFKSEVLFMQEFEGDTKSAKERASKLLKEYLDEGVVGIQNEDKQRYFIGDIKKFLTLDLNEAISRIERKNK